MRDRISSSWLIVLLGAVFITGCSSTYYREKADKQVYDILTQTELGLFGKTNSFSIETRYSDRDPDEIPAMELITERALDGTNVTLSLEQALTKAYESNRNYKTRKEQLYLTALTLTLRQWDFAKRPFGQLRGGFDRESDKDVRIDSNGNRFGFTEALKSGGTFSLSLANDMVRYFTGDPRRSINTVVSANLAQPLLRGSSARIIAENLTQAERDVIYAIRDFALFQQTFGVEIVTDYFRLLQRQDNVRNAYNNYQSLVETVNRLEALQDAERIPRFQVDQAEQQRLSGRSSYLRAVQQYQAQLDEFKKKLEIPQGVHLNLDTSGLDQLKKIGLQVVRMSDRAGYESAVTNKFDILNEVDRFEDSKRKIWVAADALRANLTFLTDVSLANETTDYADFDPGNFQTSVGLQLDLPFDRRAQRNTYRTSLIDFERQVRSLSLTLDNARDAVREDLRELEQLRQNFEIQKQALVLATERVNVTPELIDAQRAQTRDELEARNALLQAQNAVTGVLVDYLAARLSFLVDVGVLNMDGDKWWLKTNQMVATSETGPVPELNNSQEGIFSPEQVFSGLTELN